MEGYTPMYLDTGVITSPNYPSNYPQYYHGYSNRTGPNHAGFVAAINIPSDVQYVELTFTTFDIEECGSDCTCDGLYISGLAQPMCGNSLPNGDGIVKIDHHQIRDGKLVFGFYSDTSTTRQGFYLKYHIVRAAGGTSPSTGCSYVTCPYCPYGSHYSRDMYGCQVCQCHSAPATTSHPIVSAQRSLLLQILMNLEHRAETLEKSVHDLQEQLQMALGVMQGGLVRRNSPGEEKTKQ
ncbi:blastula protease 10-like [Gigantopelta aegis]|uniref:blastula protease 10-like n=1 Tax=Gigantopelta aegis TaxID=1735272 RepID=UPI001B888B52|nr:blastula protease 10-like [Gigantopelta aegis]